MDHQGSPRKFFFFFSFQNVEFYLFIYFFFELLTHNLLIGVGREENKKMNALPKYSMEHLKFLFLSFFKLSGSDIEMN